MTFTQQDIEARLAEINKKLDAVMREQEKIVGLLSELSGGKGEVKKAKGGEEPLPLDVVTLLSLPDHLRKTAYALSKLGGKATAEQVAKETERTRAIESAYLNQLQRLGYINRKREGHKVVYSTP